MSHLRANLWLTCLTLVLCSFFYPALLWVIGREVFPHQAEGSILAGPDKKPIGSRLIAQPFSREEYFQPRPSAVGYNAAASGGSNWASSNYLLRDRVARTLGLLVKYRDGRLLAPDIDTWFHKNPALVNEWATGHPDVARAWANADPGHAKLIEDWKKTQSGAVRDWKSANSGEPTPADLAPAFFRDFVKNKPGSWPKGNGDPLWSVPAVFFDRWLRDHPSADLQPVPADLVMTSGSGLDPHITLKNARYQLDRVAGAWAKILNRDHAKVRQEIEVLLTEIKEAPFGGWFGGPLVNVLEINLALKTRMKQLPKS